jgi:hypothetical protein
VLFLTASATFGTT